MLKSKFTRNKNFAKEIEAEMLQVTKKELQQQYQHKLNSLTCSEHHQHPKVKVTGTSFKNMKAELDGCCERFLQEAYQELAKL